ncbi:hypothetical protein F7725_027283 [Dissostichus mawsoni]|uniref:EXS domain-containing protein n=1 Tax=Dissostichus mawsoni TaxID=36200 RepID=A0A7J5XCI1_DISMA|nr:hypothetical protein F7725_027283 [Dissostichus mawsoni]
MFHLSQEERCKHHNIKDLKLAFSEFYLSLILLQNYQPALAWTTFRVGLYCGFFIILAIAFILSVPLPVGHQHLRMAAGRVNHVLIFEINPRNNLSHQHLFEIAGFLGVLWCLSILSCLYSDYTYLPMQINPLILYGFMLLFLINPFKTGYYKSRFWLLKLLLNSLVFVLMDLEYLVCYYIFELQWSNSRGLLPRDQGHVCHSYSYGLRAVIQCLPAWFRFVQCLRRYRDTKRAFPHLVNAGKYSTTFFVVTFAALYATHREQGHTDADMFFYLLIVFSSISSLYTLIWDLRMDWGLFDRGAGENTFLREEIAYYYCAIIEDVILRFAWTIQISLSTTTKIHSVGDIVSTVLAPMEVFRRFVWNFFRLENEHLNNCGEFRAVRDISVAPLNADDQTLLEQMMDSEEGVRNRSGKKTWKRSYSLSLRRPLLGTSLSKKDTKVLIEDTDDEAFS